MSDLHPGDTVALRAQFEKGAFPDEYLVTFPSLEGQISGFVREPNAVHRDGEQLYLRGRIEAIGNAAVTIFVRGSFFTNSGFFTLNTAQFDGSLVKVFA